MVNRARTGQRGAALLFAVSALATMAAVSLALLTLARSEREAGQLAVARIQARAAALGALAGAMNGWPSGSVPLVPGDSTLVASYAASAALGSASLWALGGPVYALRANGTRHAVAGAALAEARLEMLVLLRQPDSNSVVRPRSYPRGLGWLP